MSPAPNGYVADPSNPGWYYDPNGDASKEDSWWQAPPEGFIADPESPGWYYNPQGDPNNKSTWWADRTVVPVNVLPIGAFDLWSAAEIAGITGCPIENVQLYWPLVYNALLARGQASPASCAGAIGTIAIESASRFASVEEAFWLTPAQRLAYYLDTSQHAVYSGGPQYHGRGLIQLTHDYNYREAGGAIGEDLVGNPDLALNPGPASEVFAWYWWSRDIQAPADGHDWTTVRRKVQGGTAGLPRLIQISEDLLRIL